MRPELQRVFAHRLTDIVAQGVSRIGVAPRHVGGIGRKTSAAISGIGAEKLNSRHLAAKAVIENVADGALRKKVAGSTLRAGLHMSGSRRVGHQRLIQRGVALEAGATRPVLIRQSNVRVDVAHDQIV